MPLNLAYLFDLYTWENEYSVVMQNSKGPSFRVVTEKLQNKLKMRTVLQETNQMFGDDAFLRRSFRRSISHWLHPWGWTTDSQCLWYGNQIPQFKHQFSRLHIQSKFGHQRKQCLKKTSKKIVSSFKALPRERRSTKKSEVRMTDFRPRRTHAVLPKKGRLIQITVRQLVIWTLPIIVCISFYFHLQLCSVAHCWEQFSLFLSFLSLAKIRS